MREPFPPIRPVRDYEERRQGSDGPPAHTLPFQITGEAGVIGRSRRLHKVGAACCRARHGNVTILIVMRGIRWGTLEP